MRMVRLPPSSDNRGEVGPPNSIRTEKVAPVSRRKEMNHSDSVMTTQDPLLGMALVRPKESRAPSVIQGQTYEVGWRAVWV